MKKTEILVFIIAVFLAGSGGDLFADGAIKSNYDVQFYGKIKADLSYDDSRLDSGNWHRWVQSEAVNKDDAEFNMTANETRLGLNFSGPENEVMKTTGKLEVDFQEGGAENKSRLMMRHAYMQLDWPEVDMSLIAGQTWDVAFPLLAPTLNYTVLWWQGNPGYRRPQVRFSKGMDISEDMSLLFQTGLFRTIGDSGAGFTPGDTGEDSPVPTVQARLAFSLPLVAEQSATIGISGLTGTEEWDIDATGNNSKDLDTSAICLDLTIPLAERILLKSEIWSGKNLDAYLAGIGQGVNSSSITDPKEIKSSGGWFALSFGPYDNWRFNIGAGLDNPKDNDLTAGYRAKNQVVYANVIYNVNEAVQMGLELADLETKYMGQDDADAMRIQTSVIYNF